MALKQAMTVTEAAAQRIQALLARRGKPSVGIRVGVRSRGCSGLTYTLEYADEKGKFDEMVQDKGVTILECDKEAFRKRVLPQTENFVKARPEAKPVVDIIHGTQA